VAGAIINEFMRSRMNWLHYLAYACSNVWTNNL